MGDQSLQDFVTSVSGESHLRVEQDFGDGFVRLRTSEADRRQAAQDIQNSESIVLEMLRNSRDAHASNIFIASSKEESRRRITIIDDGDGIPPSMHALVFEPRVTSKLDTSHMDAWGMHGRGMALFSIAENSLKSFVVASDAKLGAAIHVETDTAKLPEKTDQSSFPRFELSESGTVNVRGPRNIIRTACEFAIDSRAQCSVFLGSPSEIAATLLSYGTATLSSIDRVFCNDPSTLPVTKRLATAADPASFAEIAASLGLEISERTARRILDGQTDELPAIIDLVSLDGPETGSRKRYKRGKGVGDHRSFKLHNDDKATLAHAVRESFSDVAERYYLEEDVNPQVRALRDRIIITIPVVHKD